MLDQLSHLLNNQQGFFSEEQWIAHISNMDYLNEKMITMRKIRSMFWYPGEWKCIYLSNWNLFQNLNRHWITILIWWQHLQLNILEILSPVWAIDSETVTIVTAFDLVAGNVALLVRRVTKVVDVFNFDVNNHLYRLVHLWIWVNWIVLKQKNPFEEFENDYLRYRRMEKISCFVCLLTQVDSNY